MLEHPSYSACPNENVLLHYHQISSKQLESSWKMVAHYNDYNIQTTTYKVTLILNVIIIVAVDLLLFFFFFYKPRTVVNKNNERKKVN